VNDDATTSESYLEAESHLRDIHEGRGGVGPDAPEYRDAMFQLGRILVMQERWLEATEIIEGGLRRYPEDVRVPEFSTLGGIARMSHAEVLARQLSSSTEVPREGIVQARNEAIHAAIGLFDRSIALLDVPGESSRTPLEMEYLRSAYLERAAAHADLGQYENAIQSYWDIERRFGEDVTAIESLIRISNLATKQGDEQEADRAMSRVLVLLRRSAPGRGAGPDLLEDIDSGTLQQWITLQPPGEEGVSP
jgi:tetratricopeptide (TPR) repeat protein